MTSIIYRDAVAKALADSMREEPRLILIGQNLTGHALKQLAETYGAERVRDCSISESAIRSLTLPPGLRDSSFASTSAPPARTTCRNRTSGVRPIRSRTESVMEGQSHMSVVRNE